MIKKADPVIPFMDLPSFSVRSATAYIPYGYIKAMVNYRSFIIQIAELVTIIRALGYANCCGKTDFMLL
jgi:hypothetical protein